MSRTALMFALGLMASLASAHGFPPPPPPSPPCPDSAWQAPQAPGCTIAGNVLIFDDGIGGGAALRACQNLGLSPTLSTVWANFDPLLQSGARWDLVIVLNDLPWNLPSTAHLNHLQQYLQGGGPGSPTAPRLIVHTAASALAGNTHPLFTEMGVSPSQYFAPHALCDHLRLSDPYLDGMTAPASFASLVGFSSFVFGQPIPAVASAYLQPIPGAIATDPALVIRDDLSAMFLGFAPHLLAPAPRSGDAWMANVIARMLTPPGADDLAVESVNLVPGAGIRIGEQVTVEVQVSNTFSTPISTLVELFSAPLEAAPALPTTGAPYSTVLNVPAGGVATAVFAGLPTPTIEECWRIHAVVNGNGAHTECDLANNIDSGGLCVMDSGCPLPFADCNGDGDVANILDALTAARAGAGFHVPTSPCACDIDHDTQVTVLDALIFAQVAASLLPRPTPPAGVASAPSVTALPVVDVGGAHEWEMDICATSPVELTFEKSLDGGSSWTAATAHPCSPMGSSISGVAPAIAMEYLWATDVDVPAFTRPATADLRVRVHDPVAGTQVIFTETGITIDP